MRLSSGIGIAILLSFANTALARDPKAVKLEASVRVHDVAHHAPLVSATLSVGEGKDLRFLKPDAEGTGTHRRSRP